MASSSLRILRLLALLSCSLASSAVIPANISFTTTLRRDVIGIGGVRHGFDYMSEDVYRGLNDTLRHISTSRLCAARMRIARTWYGSDWAMPVWGGPMNFTSPRMQAFTSWLADLNACNVTVAWAAGWWFTQNVCASDAPATCTPSEADVAIYTAWVSATINELVVKRGLTNLKMLVAFTEPLSYNSGNIPPGYSQESFYVHVLTALHERLVADGVRSLVQIQAPNDGGLSSPSMLAALNFTVSNLNNVVDLYSSHDYSLSGYEAWFNLYAGATAITAPTGKPFIMDEGGNSDEAYRNTSDYGTYLASMHAAALNAGASGFTSWLWQDQHYVWPLQNASNGDSFYNGLHRWGTQPWLPYDVNVRPSYYVLSTLALRFGPRTLGLDARASSVVTSGYVSGVAFAALAGNSDDLAFRSILIVNENSTPVNVSINLVDYVCNCGTQALQRYAYDPAAVPTDNGPLVPGGTYDGSGAPLLDSIPARGVVVWAP